MHSGELAREWKEESCDEEKEKEKEKEKKKEEEKKKKEEEEEERASIRSSKRYCNHLTRTEHNK